MSAQAMKKNTDSGFTIVELLVSMVISSFVIAGVYGVYTIQQRSYTVQEQVAEMQQRIRAAVDAMSREIRMAGYAPKAPYDAAGVCAGATISKATADEFEFSYCDVELLSGSGASAKYGSKLIKSSYKLYDAYSDKVIDFCVKHDVGDFTPVAEGVDALEFRYFDEPGVLSGIPMSYPVDITKLRAVEVSILVRGSYPDLKYIDRIQHLPRSGNSAWFSPNPRNDNYHRRLLITSIQLRNNIK